MTIERQTVSTGTPWEERVGYARVVRVGPHVWVSGTVASNEIGVIHAPDDAGAQARFIFDKIDRALREAGASIRDVVRVRVYLVDMDDVAEVGRAHHERFADIRPANTTVEVSRLATPECRVEIEVEAFIID
ncbi:MAG: RidA family protein [Phycisphaerales bacterium]